MEPLGRRSVAALLAPLVVLQVRQHLTGGCQRWEEPEQDGLFVQMKLRL